MTPYERRIQNYLSSHPGATRAEARGHGATPERPERAVNNPGKYRDYISHREDLKRQVQAKIVRLGSGSNKWRRDRSARNIANYKGSNRNMELFLNDELVNRADFSWTNENGEPNEQYSFMWYH